MPVAIVAETHHRLEPQFCSKSDERREGFARCLAMQHLRWHSGVHAADKELFNDLYGMYSMRISWHSILSVYPAASGG